MRNTLFIVDRKSSVDGVGCFGLRGKGVVLVGFFDKVIDLAFAVFPSLSFACQLIMCLSLCS